MAYNGSGVFTGLAASHPVVTATVIDSDKHNNLINDIDLPMATYKHTGVGDAAALTDYASANQVVDNALTYGGASAAGTDTYAVSLTISPGAYVAGNRFQFLADVANTDGATLNINSLGAKAILLADGGALEDGHILANSIVDVIYDGTQFLLLNPWIGGNEITFEGTTSSISAGSTATAVLTHELGTDDVEVWVAAYGSVDDGEWMASVGLYGGYNYGIPGTPAAAEAYPSNTTPSTGDVTVKFKNTDGGAQTITYRVVIKKRA